MVAAVRDLLEALSSMGIEIEAHGDRLRYRPRSAMTPDILGAVKSCEAGLLEILQSNSLLPDSGSSESRQLDLSTDAVSSARVDSADEYTTSTSKADREFDRFEAVAIRYPDGSGMSGVYDPAFGSEMPSGVSWESWRAFERDCGRLGKSRIVTNSRDLEQLEDCCNV